MVEAIGGGDKQIANIVTKGQRPGVWLVHGLHKSEVIGWRRGGQSSAIGRGGGVTIGIERPCCGVVVGVGACEWQAALVVGEGGGLATSIRAGELVAPSVVGGGGVAAIRAGSP